MGRRGKGRELYAGSDHTVMAGSANGAQVLPGDAENSPPYFYVAPGLMPPSRTRSLSDEMELLRTWIEEAALNN